MSGSFGTSARAGSGATDSTFGKPAFAGVSVQVRRHCSQCHGDVLLFLVCVVQIDRQT